MLRFLDAGESHGKGLVGIIDGFPANFPIDIDEINKELKRRQGGYGRGGRMQIERDKIDITSGIRYGKTLGSPIALYIENKDWKNWSEVMSIYQQNNHELSQVNRPRPGHADLPGGLKYHQKDLRNILERASARETAMRVAIGAIAKQLLRPFDIHIYSHVLQIGSAKTNSPDFRSKYYDKIEASEVRVLDEGAEFEMRQAIDQARKIGDTLGGIFEVIAANVPVGLGSHVHWDRKIDGKIAQGFMSLQAIKGVEIGAGFEAGRRPGSKIHDEIFYDKEYKRRTNGAGGIEGGMTNGSPIVVRAAMKPIPSLTKPLRSVDMITKEPFDAQKERSDVCAVPAASIVGEAILAWVLAEEMILKFGGDSYEQMINQYQYYMDYIRSR